MNSEEFNTNQLSLDRIYCREYFLWFNFNSREPGKNMIEMMEFFVKATEKAKKNHIEKWHIAPSYDEGNYDNSPSVQLVAVGYRPETDEECERRLKYEVIRTKKAYENWKAREIYYTSTGEDCYHARLLKLDTAIQAIQSKKCESEPNQTSSI